MRSDVDTHVKVRDVWYQHLLSLLPPAMQCFSLLLQDCPLIYPCYMHCQSSSLSVSSNSHVKELSPNVHFTPSFACSSLEANRRQAETSGLALERLL